MYHVWQSLLRLVIERNWIKLILIWAHKHTHTRLIFVGRAGCDYLADLPWANRTNLGVKRFAFFFYFQSHANNHPLTGGGWATSLAENHARNTSNWRVKKVVLTKKLRGWMSFSNLSRVVWNMTDLWIKINVNSCGFVWDCDGLMNWVWFCVKSLMFIDW